MGISLAISIAAAAIFLTYAVLRNTIPGLFLIPLIHASAIGFTVALFSHPVINIPWIFQKSPSGSYPLWSYILFYPYLIGAQLYVRLKRSILASDSSESTAYSEICDGLFVGGWPCEEDHLPPGRPAIVDCTNELPRMVGLELPYLCIPAWDTRAPTPDSIELAVRWAMKKRALNHPIFIHCAKGHGRSVAVMCALLVALGVVSDWREGEILIKRHRSHIRLNSAQKKSLEEWQLRRSQSVQ